MPINPTRSRKPETISRVAAFFASRTVRTLGWLVVGSVFISGLIGGYHRGRENQPDWRDFCRESQYVWQHRAIPPGTSMFGYLPAAFMALWPFTQWTPPTVGLVAFIAVNTLAAVGSCFILYRWWFLGRGKTGTHGNLRAPKTTHLVPKTTQLWHRRPAGEGAGGPPSGAPSPPGVGDGIARVPHPFQGWGTDTPGNPKPAAFVWPLFLIIAHIQHVLQANQFTLWVLLLCVAGLTQLRHRRDLLGGLLLGLGVCIKVTPAVFLVYLALRRQWKALAAMILAVIVFDIVPSVILFGADGAVREHRMWLRRAGWYSNSRLIEEPSLRIRRHGHNCAYSLVLARWLRPPPPADYQVILHGQPPADVVAATRAALQADEYLVLDPMPTPGAVWSKTRDKVPDLPRFRLAHLSAPTVWWIWAVTLAGCVGTLAVATHRRRRAPRDSTAWAAEAGLWMLLMLWLSPMMRDYYLALTLPAYIILWRTALVGKGTAWPSAATNLWHRPPACDSTGETPASQGSSQGANKPIVSGAGHSRKIAAGAIAVCYLSVLGLSWHTATFYGLHLATLAALTTASAWTWKTASSGGPGRTRPGVTISIRS